jgi:hypothetical protein
MRSSGTQAYARKRSGADSLESCVLMELLTFTVSRQQATGDLLQSAADSTDVRGALSTCQYIACTRRTGVTCSDVYWKGLHQRKHTAVHQSCSS